MLELITPSWHSHGIDSVCVGVFVGVIVGVCVFVGVGVADNGGALSHTQVDDTPKSVIFALNN